MELAFFSSKAQKKILLLYLEVLRKPPNDKEKNQKSEMSGNIVLLTFMKQLKAFP